MDIQKGCHERGLAPGRVSQSLSPASHRGYTAGPLCTDQMMTSLSHLKEWNPGLLQFLSQVVAKFHQWSYRPCWETRSQTDALLCITGRCWWGRGLPPDFNHDFCCCLTMWCQEGRRRTLPGPHFPMNLCQLSLTSQPFHEPSSWG